MGIQLLDKERDVVVEVASETQTLKNASGGFLLYVLFGGLYIGEPWIWHKTEPQTRINPILSPLKTHFWRFKNNLRPIQYSGGKR